MLPGRLKLTDATLLEEASRYPANPKLSFSLGLWVSSSSTLSLGPDKALLVSKEGGVKWSGRDSGRGDGPDFVASSAD